jgi:hypothetical protein
MIKLKSRLLNRELKKVFDHIVKKLRDLISK